MIIKTGKNISAVTLWLMTKAANNKLPMANHRLFLLWLALISDQKTQGTIARANEAPTLATT